MYNMYHRLACLVVLHSISIGQLTHISYITYVQVSVQIVIFSLVYRYNIYGTSTRDVYQIKYRAVEIVKKYIFMLLEITLFKVVVNVYNGQNNPGIGINSENCQLTYYQSTNAKCNFMSHKQKIDQ